MTFHIFLMSTNWSTLRDLLSILFSCFAPFRLIVFIYVHFNSHLFLLWQTLQKTAFRILIRRSWAKSCSLGTDWNKTLGAYWVKILFLQKYIPSSKINNFTILHPTVNLVWRKENILFVFFIFYFVFCRHHLIWVW